MLARRGVSVLSLSLVLLAACSPAVSPDGDLNRPDSGSSATPTATAVPEANADVAKGRDLIEAQKYAEAIPVLEKAVAGDPKNPDANYYLGLTYDQSGKKAEVEAKYKAALALK